MKRSGPRPVHQLPSPAPKEVLRSPLRLLRLPRLQCGSRCRTWACPPRCTAAMTGWDEIEIPGASFSIETWDPWCVTGVDGRYLPHVYVLTLRRLALFEGKTPATVGVKARDVRSSGSILILTHRFSLIDNTAPCPLPSRPPGATISPPRATHAIVLYLAPVLPRRHGSVRATAFRYHPRPTR